MDLKVGGCHGKKYFKYLSELPEQNSLSPDTCFGLRLVVSGDSDKYLKYLLLIEL